MLEDAGFRRHRAAQSISAADGRFTISASSTRRRVGSSKSSPRLREEIRAGTPVVGLEPSCVAVFRDELSTFSRTIIDAQRLSKQTFTAQRISGETARRIFIRRSSQRKALVHGHCHHKAVMKMACEEKLLDQIGLDCEMPDTGCCGMAGAFGFEAEQYEVSIACGERVLLPAVREACKDTLIIADGFRAASRCGKPPTRAAAFGRGSADGFARRKKWRARRLSGEELHHADAGASFARE